MFKLDEKLANDSYFIADLKLSQLILMNNANYPWLILVPKIAGAAEITDLDFANQTELLREINQVAKILQDKFNPHKLNIANLGNMVRQLHIHVIARFKDDAAFPRPVWGEASQKYEESAALKLIEEIRKSL